MGEVPAAAGGIEVAGLTKRFGALEALTGVDLEVGRGELVALLGPNGAGKTTLLRILGTTLLPDAGRATVAGLDVVARPQQVRAVVGLVLGNERSFYWRLTGRHNLEFFASLHGLDRRVARDRATELLDLLGLTEAADRRFDGYSSGMKARLGLARALLADPPVLLLDEPTRTLDPVAAADFRRQVVALARDRGRAALFATHDLHEAAALADRVVVLAGGRVATRLPGGTDAAGLEAALLDVVGREGLGELAGSPPS